MYTVTNKLNTRPLTRPPHAKGKVASTPLHTYQPIWKACEHCKTLYRAMHGHSQHCYLCASCGLYKPFAELAGKAQYIGYICLDCYRAKEHVRNMVYTLLLRL